MVSKILVVGVGPGTGEYVTPAARKAVETADVLVGGRRALALFSYLSRPTHQITADLNETIEFIKANFRSKRVAVLVTGDPGCFSLLPLLVKHFGSENLEVVPGISSIQLAFARLKEVWQNVTLVSLHGRGLKELETVEDGSRLAILTDPRHTPAVIGRHLISLGLDDCPVAVCENLGLPEEKIVQTRLYLLPEYQGGENSVVVILDAG
ncbi:precorrin-6y C5,15-methyltransferase (decarboxylating) subunit CbiE [Calderihabitans maritimus]|uniref:Precorrin-6y C5,15-methyltransferase subunit CbiE n=1 Tax=Calderihabitans maritimus TaxID=1246530 RepID=A0A1Z5HQ12_9FIRM|nr:precorrin-6y C5,15-methyltransferase (decarboxylating) subunit CbiE [Calderihabitans maritimus]GAW91528.1 precorrin-6y C5,15-methyltransferase subunit CbiE [Calderihabitans maritimus]